MWLFDWGARQAESTPIAEEPVDAQMEVPETSDTYDQCMPSTSAIGTVVTHRGSRSETLHRRNKPNAVRFTVAREGADELYERDQLSTSSSISCDENSQHSTNVSTSSRRSNNSVTRPPRTQRRRASRQPQQQQSLQQQHPQSSYVSQYRYSSASFVTPHNLGGDMSASMAGRHVNGPERDRANSLSVIANLPNGHALSIAPQHPQSTSVASTSSAFDLRRMLRMDSAMSLIKYATGSQAGSNSTLADDGPKEPRARYTPASSIDSIGMRKQIRLVQETDACFFENFGCLGSRLDQAKLDVINRPSKRRRGTRRLSFQLARFQKPNDRLKEDLYMEVLYTVCHRVGISYASLTQQQLYDYAQQAFNIGEDRQHILMNAAQHEKPPVIILNVIVCEAKGLIAKDVDGFSDPFCMLGIVPGRRNSACNLKRSGAVKAVVSATAPPPEDTLSVNSHTNSLHLQESTMDSGHSSPNLTDHETGTSASCETNVVSSVSPVPIKLSSGGFISRVKGSFRRKSKRTEGKIFGRNKDEDLTMHRRKGHNKCTNSLVQNTLELTVADDRGKEGVKKVESLPLPTPPTPPSPAPPPPPEPVPSPEPSPEPSLYEEEGMIGGNGVIPAKLIKATSVQPNTLQPTWNEKFQLVVDDPGTDRFHLDIWDHDDETSVVDAVGKLNEVNSLRGLGRYFKEVAQSARTKAFDTTDDFLGSVTINVKHVTAKGLEEWFTLQPRSEKSKVSGEILLKLWLGTREDRIGHDEGDNMLDIQQHISIIKQFADYEIRTKLRGDAMKWHGQFSDAATSILHQHAIQGDLTDTQRALCQWIAHCWLHFYDSLDYSFLYELLMALLSKWEPTNLTKDEEEMLAECLSLFQTFAYTNLVQHRDVFSANNVGSQINIEHLLKCLNLLHENANFKRVLPFQRELFTELTTITQRSAVHYFNRAKSMVQAHEGCEPDDSYGALAKLITLINAACTAGLNCYAPPFQRVTGIDYFTLTYMEFDELLHGELYAAQIAENLERRSLNVLDFTATNVQQSIACQRILIPLFELHITLSEFIAYRKHCDAESGSRTQVRNFTHFFEKTVAKWLQFAKELLVARIDLACSLDKHIQTESTEIRQSTSYVDICYTVKQMIDFWDRLVIPNQMKKASFNERLVQIICQSLEYYTEKMFSVLATTSFYELQASDDLHDAIKQFCVTVNDAEQARRVVSDLSDKLHMDDITNALQLKQDKTAALKWRSSLEHLIDSCRACIAGQMDMAMQRLIHLQSDQYSKNIFHMAWSPKGCDIEGAMKPLLDLLDEHMSNYHQWLLHRNFVRYLNVQFKCILELLDKTVMENEGQADEFHHRLADALVMLTDFFHAGGRGLSMETIAEIPVYRKLNKALKLYATPTAKLIERYYRNLLDQQTTLSECKFGILNVRVYFNAIADLLVVDVLSAKRIIPLDSNGLSDPFVIVELVPNYCFPQCPVVKTRVVSKTLNPVYEETFEFTVYEHELPNTAMIHFVVMDYDLLRSNDFAGEAFIDINDVPGFGIVDDKTAKEVALRQFNLILMNPEEKDEEVLSVLKHREEDELAVDFCKHIANVRYT